MAADKYNPETVGVNSTITFDAGDELCGFLATTTGNITIVDSRGISIVTAHPVAAGTWTTLPFYIGPNATFTTAGGASGTVAVG